MSRHSTDTVEGRARICIRRHVNAAAGNPVEADQNEGELFREAGARRSGLNGLE